MNKKKIDDDLRELIDLIKKTIEEGFDDEDEEDDCEYDEDDEDEEDKEPEQIKEEK